ncbi:MAG TPA: pentapeptide repeat-containing protein [Bosea sp. (in: a-proteobacteria)]|jgi:hypothetical protein|uniref:pentapeptide repeat-containing protein n=1 Tax=Bosea sp. (in: a-proteobacteria) TaxID=1871050 RepID=UPI002DDD6979|nr:pentapeptide repeat-containing protein [Bosea sp. (in: a-proteobacteria)]HEV2556477.1 pentapeptide repeat-containing protein [Bosea sp. (in: a-proteobacteria)]
MNSKFSGLAEFGGSSFSDHANFSDSIFSGRADFEGASLADATFSKAKFGAASFQQARFFGEAVFDNATFVGGTTFAKASFSKRSSFLRAVYSSDAIFDGVTFFGSASFDKVSLSGTAGFQNAAFAARVGFEDAKLQSATNFAGVRFTRDPPRFHGASLHEGTQWHGALWPPTPDDTEQAQQHVYSYERLKQEMERLKKHDDELQFFEREMRSRRIVEGKRSAAGLLNLAYDCLSGYGRSILRPMLGLVATFLLGILVMVNTVGWPRKCWYCPTSVVSESAWNAVKQAALLSFANMLAPLNVRKDFFDADMLAGLPGWLKMFAGLQTLLALAFAFLIGLALRNRFRLR